MKRLLFFITVLVLSMNVQSQTNQVNDSLAIYKRIESKFAEWNQKGEFEKTTTYEDRLKSQSKKNFSRISKEVIEEYAKEILSSGRYESSISKYDADKESFICTFTINGQKYTKELGIPLDKAQKFKEAFPYMERDGLSNWYFQNGKLCPKFITLTDEQKNSGITFQLNITSSVPKGLCVYFDKMKIQNPYLTGYVYAYDPYEIEDDEEIEDDDESDAEAVSENDVVFLEPDKDAQFPGGPDACMEWIASHLKYPVICKENGIQGRVIVSYIINKDGSITEVNAVRSPDENLSKEAVRVVSTMPKWNPARQRGKVVRCRFTLPVVFRIS